MARTRLSDARLSMVSIEGRFSSAYTAAHAAAVAALRWHSYRSENRFLVFQCLEHTVAWEPSKWRVLTAAHNTRNRVEYEGFVELEERGVAELIRLAQLLIDDVDRITA